MGVDAPANKSEGSAQGGARGAPLGPEGRISRSPFRTDWDAHEGTTSGIPECVQAGQEAVAEECWQLLRGRKWGVRTDPWDQHWESRAARQFTRPCGQNRTGRQKLTTRPGPGTSVCSSAREALSQVGTGRASREGAAVSRRLGGAKPGAAPESGGRGRAGGAVGAGADAPPGETAPGARRAVLKVSGPSDGVGGRG